MPTQTVHLPEELESFVLEKVETGRYENATEVVRAALMALEREEREHDKKLAVLRAAIDEGDNSGVVDGNPFDRVRAAIKTGHRIS